MDEPALVTLTGFGVSLGLAVTEVLEFIWRAWRGDVGVEGVAARIVVTGVFGLVFAGGVNVECAWTRVFETDEGIFALNRLEVPLFVVALAGRGVFRACSACFSLAKRRLSLVRPDRVCGGLWRGITFAEGGVLKAVNSVAVPKLGASPVSRSVRFRAAGTGVLGVELRREGLVRDCEDACICLPISIVA